jgi:outer membrane protein TolC
MLVLLAGERAASADLSSPLVAGEIYTHATDRDGQRADVKSAEFRAEAARAMVAAARGSMLPEVMAQATLETMRSDFTQ